MKKITKMLLIFSFIAVIAVVISGGSFCKSSAQEDNIYENLSLFTETMKKVQELYWTNVNTKDLIYGALKGMLSSLDRYSSFMTPDQYKEMKVETEGSFGGIGIEITLQDNILTVVSPIEDTPAFRAGIKSGDRIIEINGESTQKMSLEDAVKRLRGPKGTSVTITIFRDEFKEPKKITLVREIILIKSVKYKLIEPGYGYVRITQFQERTSSDLKNAIETLEKSGGELKGLILDLRLNPGGLLDEAIKVADLFLDSGIIVSTDGRLASQKHVWKAESGNDWTKSNMIVLIDKGSASASEIVAGALRDNNRAVLMGSTSFGKGTVQTIYPLQDGSALRLTTAHYFTPSGESIEEKGIKPDIAFEQPVTKEDVENKRSVTKEPDLGSDEEVQRALEYLKSWQIFSQTSTKSKIKENQARVKE
jgi:carboxyl-terminal processing protease